MDYHGNRLYPFHCENIATNYVLVSICHQYTGSLYRCTRIRSYNYHFTYSLLISASIESIPSWMFLFLAKSYSFKALPPPPSQCKKRSVAKQVIKIYAEITGSYCKKAIPNRLQPRIVFDMGNIWHGATHSFRSFWIVHGLFQIFLEMIRTNTYAVLYHNCYHLKLWFVNFSIKLLSIYSVRIVHFFLNVIIMT